MRARGLTLGLLGLLAYLIFLVATLPAARAWAWFGESVPLQAYGLDGTLWHGRAAVMQDELRRLEAVQWEIRPLSLLRGNLSAEVQARLPGDGRLRSTVHLRPNRLRAEDLRLELPAPLVLTWAGIDRLPVTVDGRFESLLRELVLVDERLLRADGLLSWNSATLALGRQPLPLGNLALRLRPGEDAILGTLTSQGGPLSLDGDLRLAPDGRFVLDMTARLSGEIDDATRRIFTAVGVPADGSPIQARLSGSLDGTGVSLQALNR